MNTRKLGVLVFLLLLTGCDAKQLVPDLSHKVDESNAKLAALEAQVNGLTKEISVLEAKQGYEDVIRDFDKFAYLTPGAEGYSIVKFDLGFLTVSLDDIKPYANGSKITLRIGNTLSATVDGLKATLEWGKVDSNGMPINSEAKSKEITLKQPLAPASWTRTTIVLDGVKPSELGFVRLKGVTHRGIRLYSSRS